MAWLPLTEPNDTLTVSGRPSPGICEISGAAASRRWDIRKGYALQGARAVFRGMDVARFRTRFRLITPQHWEEWHRFLPLIARPPSGTRPQALDVWHPILEDLEITQAVVESVSQAERVGETGEWAITVAWIEYRQPAPLVVTASGSTAQAESELAGAIRYQRAGVQARQGVLAYQRQRLGRQINRGQE